MPSQGIQKGMREGSEQGRGKTKRRSRWVGVFLTRKAFQNKENLTGKGGRRKVGGAKNRWGGVGGMGFALKLPILVGECGGCGIRIDLARLWALILAVFGP